MERDLRARFDNREVTVPAAHFDKRRAGAAFGPCGPMDFFETFVRFERGRQRADKKIRGVDRASAGRRTNFYLRIEHLRNERKFCSRVRMRETAADSAA